MAEPQPAGGRPENLPLGATNELLGVTAPENQIIPQTPEEWHLYAIDSMAELAAMGATRVDRSPGLRDWTTVSFGALGTARVDYTEELHPEGEVLDDPGCLVKVHPAPSFVMPPVNAPLSVFEQAREMYEADVADPPEIGWESRTAHVITVKRGNDERELSALSEHELRMYAERLRGVATAVALELKDYATLARLRNVWGPDPDMSGRRRHGER